MICVIRMNPPWLTIWPNAELLRLVELKPASCGRLNRLITSILIWACLLPPRLMLFEAEMSVLMIGGVRTSVSNRGALPHVPAGARLNAAGLIQVALEFAPAARRSDRLPVVASLTPGTIFGR